MNRGVLPSLLILGLMSGACTESATPDDGPPPGYRRFEVAPIPLAPGGSGQWVQYVSEPLAEAMDVVDIIGVQGPGGHHAVLYATPEALPVGTTREWTSVDQVVDRFLGGIGGEGAEAIRLPEGAVFRIPAGYALYINTHYLNASDEAIDGTSRLDVKLEPASPARRAVSVFANVDLAMRLPAGQAIERTTRCTVPRDFELVMFTNHMHDYGKATRTTITPPDGTPQVLKDDPVWVSEWQANPNFDRHPVTAPLVLRAGSVIETTCSWNNTSARELLFPDEMCLFLGFHLGDGDQSCVDGRFQD